jgi:hypothetical protein
MEHEDLRSLLDTFNGHFSSGSGYGSGDGSGSSDGDG